MNTPPSPIRKRPQQHNCMAQKKIQSFKAINNQQYAHNTKRLFSEEEFIVDRPIINKPTRNLRF